MLYFCSRGRLLPLSKLKRLQAPLAPRLSLSSKSIGCHARSWSSNRFSASHRAFCNTRTDLWILSASTHNGRDNGSCCQVYLLPSRQFLVAEMLKAYNRVQHLTTNSHTICDQRLSALALLSQLSFCSTSRNSPRVRSQAVMRTESHATTRPQRRKTAFVHTMRRRPELVSSLSIVILHPMVP